MGRRFLDPKTAAIVSITISTAGVVNAATCQNYSMTLYPSANATITSLVLRNYERFIYGDPDGFKVVDADGNSKDVAPTITYESANFSTSSVTEAMTLFGFYDGTASGSLGFGFDQYGVYWGPTGVCAADTPAGAGAVCTPNFECCGAGSSFSSCSVALYRDAMPGAAVVIRGSFLAPYAYTDVNVKYSDGSVRYATDFEYSCGDSGLNPYVPGNPSVFAPDEQPSFSSSTFAANVHNRTFVSKEHDGHDDTREYENSNGHVPSARKIPVYRPDRLHGSSYGMDHGSVGQCSDEYLCTVRDHKEMVASGGSASTTTTTATTDNDDNDDGSSNLVLPEYLLLRVRLPRVFVRSDDEPPDAVFGHQQANKSTEYESRYWSVSSHYSYTYPDPPPVLIANWWTVNARQLSPYLNEEVHGEESGGQRRAGSKQTKMAVATVFFLPPDEALALQQAQDLPTWAPPALTVNLPLPTSSTSSSSSSSSTPVVTVTGLVLPRPDFIVFRYKLPDTDFEGSPARAPCYAIPQTNRPLRPTAMGLFTPEILGCGNHTGLVAFVASLANPANPCGNLLRRLPLSSAASRHTAAAASMGMGRKPDQARSKPP